MKKYDRKSVSLSTPLSVVGFKSEIKYHQTLFSKSLRAIMSMRYIKCNSKNSNTDSKPFPLCFTDEY